MSHKNRRVKFTHILSGTASLLFTAFIWSNSLKDAAASSADSGRVLSWLNELLASIGIYPFLSSHLVRKTAHFCEFALLGLLLALTCLTARRIKSIWPVAAPSSLAVACTDELLQLFSDGRSCQISDMLLDFCGALTGIAIVFLVSRLLINYRLSHISSREQEGGS